MPKNVILRNNTVIDPKKGIDIATAISKYTSGGVQLTAGIGELAKSLTILFQDQMGYTTFTKRHGACMFDLYRESFYYVGHDRQSGPIKHRINEWQTAGDFYTFGDCESAMTATRNEIKTFAKELPAFLEKLRDDLMSSAAQSEGKAWAIHCLAGKLRECNLVIFPTPADRPDPGPQSPAESVINLIRPDGVDTAIISLSATANNAISVIDQANEDLLSESHNDMTDRHSQYAAVVKTQLRQAYIQGVDQGSRAQASGDKAADEVQDEDDLIRPFADGVLIAITALDEASVFDPAGQAERYMKYMEVISSQMKFAFRTAFRRGIDQGMAADQVGDDAIRVGPSQGSSFRSSMVVQAQRIDVGKTAVMKCPVCGAYKDLLRLSVAGTVIAYVCPNGHSYLFPHDPAHVDDLGAGDRTAAAYLQPIPGSHVQGPIPVKAERVLIRKKDGQVRRCVTCGKLLDHIMITVAGKDRAVIGVCPEGNTYLYLPSDYEDMPTAEPEKGKES